MTTVLNFGGTGRANQYVFRNVPPTILFTYDTKMTLELAQASLDGVLVEIPTFTIENEYIVRVSMTAFLNPFPPTGVWKSYITSRNEVNYTFNFTQNYQKCQVTYAGSLNNATVFATIEDYDLLLTSSSKDESNTIFKKKIQLKKNVDRKNKIKN